MVINAFSAHKSEREKGEPSHSIEREPPRYLGRRYSTNGDLKV